MTVVKSKCTVIAAVLIVLGTSANADTVLLNEGFASLAGLAGNGWVLTNNSTPLGSTGWFQGDAGIFAAQAGAPESYAAANFNNAAVGGTISNWLITPTFSTATAVAISFWARADAFAGFADHLAYGLSATGSSNTADFTLGALVTVPTTGWTQYTLSSAAKGAGTFARFAVNYSGSADVSNYLGIDTLSVTSVAAVVPEPSTWLMLGLGLLGLTAVRRRRPLR